MTTILADFRLGVMVADSSISDGDRAGRDMVCITQHREHGEVERHRCDIGMIG